jgi:hypothetical protein
MMEERVLNERMISFGIRPINAIPVRGFKLSGKAILVVEEVFAERRFYDTLTCFFSSCSG